MIIFHLERASEIVQLSSVQASEITSATMAASVDLAFNYTLGPDDSIYNGFIVLQAKKTGTSDYENVATFSPPGSGNNFFTTTESAMILKDRSILALILFPLLTVFGNVLVVMSVYRERSLRTVTNYFICSLAVADIMVAVMVMPLAIYLEVSSNIGPQD